MSSSSEAGRGSRRVAGGSSLLALASAAVLVTGAWQALAGQSPSPREPEHWFESGSEETEFAWTREAASTQSTKFESIPALDGLPTCDVQGVVAHVGLELSGAPVDVRVRMGDGDHSEILKPGGVHFVPPAGDSSAFSFSYGKRVPGKLIDAFSVEWRSPSGLPVELSKGTLRLEHGAQDRFSCG